MADCGWVIVDDFEAISDQGLGLFAHECCYSYLWNQGFIKIFGGTQLWTVRIGRFRSTS